jgi:hypothetical protein
MLLLPITWDPSSQDPTTSTPKGTPDASVESSSKPCFINIWILNPALRYSATANNMSESPSSASPQHPAGVLAMKIFFKSVSAAAAKVLLESDAVEEVSLPTETIAEIEASLRQSAHFLPPSGQKFQDWSVGLLERFDEGIV